MFILLRLIFVLFLILVGIIAFKKIRDSKGINNFCEEISEGKKTKAIKAMRAIEEKRKQLQEEAIKNAKIAKELEKEAAEINEYLNKEKTDEEGGNTE